MIQAQRKDLEADLAQMRKDCDDATLVRVDLERKIETMVEEMEFLKKIHSDVRLHFIYHRLLTVLSINVGGP